MAQRFGIFPRQTEYDRGWTNDKMTFSKKTAVNSRNKGSANGDPDLRLPDN